MEAHSISPHCGTLVNLMVSQERRGELQSAARHWPSWDLTERQLCDLELLLNGGFSPLRGFMTKAEYEGVRDGMRLPDGTLWPMPVTLDISGEFARRLDAGAHVALRDPEGTMLAALRVEAVWEPDREREAEAGYGT